MAIDFLEWNQRNSDTERRTFWPNLWGPGWVLAGGGPVVGCAGTYGGGMQVGLKHAIITVGTKILDSTALWLPQFVFFTRVLFDLPARHHIAHQYADSDQTTEIQHTFSCYLTF